MCPEPDSTHTIGSLLYRRWGRFVRFNLGDRTVAFNLPWRSA